MPGGGGGVASRGVPLSQSCHMRAKRRLMTRLAAGAYYRPNGGAGDGVRFVTTHCWREMDSLGPTSEPTSARSGTGPALLVRRRANQAAVSSNLAPTPQ